MKIVDLVLRANEKKNSPLNKLMKNFDIQSYNARLKREEALKVKDLKEVAFGSYSVQVPSFNLCKFFEHSLVNYFRNGSLICFSIVDIYSTSF